MVDAREQSILSAALSIVRAVEAQMIGRAYAEHALGAWVQRVVLFPWRFLACGLRQQKRAFSLFAGLVAGASVPALWLAPQLHLPPPIYTLLPVALLAFPALLVTFAMPSLYMDAGLTHATCSFAARKLSMRVITQTSTSPRFKA